MPKKLPKYCLHKASGRAVVRLNGRDHYLGEYGSPQSKREYDRLIQEWTATGQSISFGFSVNTVTVAMLVADYRAHSEGYYRESSESITIRIATGYLSDYFDLPASDLSPLKLKAVREKMLASESKRTGKTQSRSYVNRLIKVICRMYRWGAENELVPITTAQSLSNVSGLKRGRCEAPETEPVKPVDDAVVEATLPHCPKVIADMIRVQRLTGMRPGEVCSLTPGMIDISGKVWVASIAEHKNAWRGKSRDVYIGPMAQQIVAKYLHRASDQPLFSPTESELARRAARHEERVTPPDVGNAPGTNRKRRPKRTPGSGYETASYRRAIARACNKAFPAPEGHTESQVKDWQASHRWAPNQLRHTAATQVRAKLGLEHVQGMLGHSDIGTSQIYAERDRSLAIEAAMLLG